jgi:tetratricopeptide (TPR) repeat protein
VGSWQGSEGDFVRFMERAYVIALDAGRKDLQTIAAQALARTHIMRLELDEAELLLTRALELAGESGSVRARINATLSYGWFLTAKGELDAAETVVEEVRTTAAELGVEPTVASALLHLGWIARLRGDHRRAEKVLREAVRMTSSRGDRGMLPDYHAVLAATLADVGKIDEAERYAVEAQANASPQDTSCKVVATTALAAVRAAQGRDAEAEELFRSVFALTREGGFEVFEIEALERFASFLRDRGREDEAAAYGARLSELAPATSTARIA